MTPQDTHTQAMSCANNGDRAQRAGDLEGARAHYARGLALEREVALAEHTQPWRGISLRSSAWLAVNAGELDEALRLARLGLADADVPERTRAELQEVVDDVMRTFRDPSIRFQSPDRLT
jgi:hypothetical protein